MTRTDAALTLAGLAIGAATAATIGYPIGAYFARRNWFPDEPEPAPDDQAAVRTAWVQSHRTPERPTHGERW